MISKAKIKFIKSLQLKKNRLRERLFIAEGHKVVGDLLTVMPAHTLVATEEWTATHEVPQTTALHIVSEDDAAERELAATSATGVGPLPPTPTSATSTFRSHNFRLLSTAFKTPAI